jgi:hypothetical protein
MAPGIISARLRRRYHAHEKRVAVDIIANEEYDLGRVKKNHFRPRTRRS